MERPGRTMEDATAADVERLLVGGLLARLFDRPLRADWAAEVTPREALSTYLSGLGNLEPLFVPLPLEAGALVATIEADGSDSPPGRKALDKLVAHLDRRWRPRGEVRAGLVELGDSLEMKPGAGLGVPYRLAKRHALIVGVIEATATLHEPRRVRIGRQYVRDEQGPVDVPVDDLVLWMADLHLECRAIALAERYVKGRKDPLRVRLGDDGKPQPTDLADAEEAFERARLVWSEYTPTPDVSEEEPLDATLAGATPRQREHIEAVRHHLYDPDGPSRAEAKRRAALDLGISVKALDMTFSRLRHSA